MSEFATNHGLQPNGFCLTFDNGYALSVQWGPGNYCDNRDYDTAELLRTQRKPCATAEVAVYNAYGKCVVPEKLADYYKSDRVIGWLTADKVVEFADAVRRL